MKPLLGRTGGVAAGVVALLLAGCGQTPRGYGVVLWGDGGVLPTGAVIHVLEESAIEGRYLVRSAGADRRQELVPVARWRVRVFPDTEQATAFAARYALFAASYGYAARNGLPVRAEASATSDIVYTLREGEVAKVLERAAQPERVGVFENYWYQVLTADGVAGYTFGEFLPVFESSGDPDAEAARLQAEDPTLERLLSTVWRPEYFRAMVRSGRYDLARFRAEYGLFPDPSVQVIRLVTEQGAHEFAYQTIERVGDDRYVVHAGEAAGPLRFAVRSATRVAASYVAGGRLVTQVFVDLKRDVAALIAAERARRDLLYADLRGRGALLRSSGYGTIELEEERRYRWHGFEALVPGLLPAGLPGTGRVDFRYAPGPALAGSYDAVVTFLFDRAAGLEQAAGAAAAESAAGSANEAAADGGAGAGEPAVEGAAAAGSGTEADPSAPIAAAGRGATGTAGSADGGAGTGASIGSPDDASRSAGTAADPGGAGQAASGATGQAAPGAAGAGPAPAVEPAAALTLLAAYDSRGVRLTPAVPDPDTLQVTHVSRSPVVMYFSFAVATEASAPDDG